MTEPTDPIQWMHDCPPGHELRLRDRDGLIEATCVEIEDTPAIPALAGETVKMCGVHQVNVRWRWTGSDFAVDEVEVSWIATDDPQ